MVSGRKHILWKDKMSLVKLRESYVKFSYNSVLNFKVRSLQLRMTSVNLEHCFTQIVILLAACADYKTRWGRQKEAMVNGLMRWLGVITSIK